MASSGKKGPPDQVAKICGERLKRCRLKAGMTQEGLSKATGYGVRGKIGLGTTQIANFEQGTRRIGIEEAVILSKLFPEYPAAHFVGVVNEREAKMLALVRSEYPAEDSLELNELSRT